MTVSALIILIHQLVFQGMFFARNLALRRKLDVPVRGRNREATVSIAFFGLFIAVSLLLAWFDPAPGFFGLFTTATVRGIAIALLVANLLIGSASLFGLGDSWRVGVLEDQETELIESGIYRSSRNPYFVSYLLMFAGYTVLLQNVILFVFSLVGFAMVHAMVLKEERHLARQHGDRYLEYKTRVPRYLII